MKATVVIILFILSASSVFSQIARHSRKEFYNLRDSLDISFFESEERKIFTIYYSKKEIPNKDTSPIYYTYSMFTDDYTYIFSEGTFTRNNNEIICYDPLFKRYYTFDILDEYTLVATKHTALFIKGDTLKMSSLWRSKDSYIQGMSWNGNKRHGMWKNYHLDEDSITYIKYKNDTIVRQYKEKRHIHYGHPPFNRGSN